MVFNRKNKFKFKKCHSGYWKNKKIERVRSSEVTYPKYTRIEVTNQDSGSTSSQTLPAGTSTEIRLLRPKSETNVNNDNHDDR